MVSEASNRLPRRLLAAILIVETAAVVGLGAVGVMAGRARADAAAEHRGLVRELHLTGLALWGDASYCRQPALSEPIAAHDAHPGAMDLLPPGSLVPPHPWRSTRHVDQLGSP